MEERKGRGHPKVTCGDFGGKSVQTGLPCGRSAGFGTDHKGTGRCKRHGGADRTGRPAKHGKYGTALPKALEHYAERLEDPSLRTLDHETGIVEALIQETIQEMAESRVASWGEALTAFKSLEAAMLGKKDPAATLTALAGLRTVMKSAEKSDELTKKLERQLALKAQMRIKGTAIEEKLGAFVPSREYIATLMLIGNWAEDEAIRCGDLGLVTRLRSLLARKGLVFAGQPALGVGSADPGETVS